MTRPRPLWHVTSKKGFRPSTKKRPVIRGGRDVATGPLLFATRDPFYWVEVAGGSFGLPWASRRRWAAELELLPGHPPIDPHEDPLAAETVLDPAFVRVIRIIPVEHAIAEVTGWLKAGPGGSRWVGDYVYPGPDFPPIKRKRTSRA